MGFKDQTAEAAANANVVSGMDVPDAPTTLSSVTGRPEGVGAQVAKKLTQHLSGSSGSFKANRLSKDTESANPFKQKQLLGSIEILEKGYAGRQMNEEVGILEILKGGEYYLEGGGCVAKRSEGIKWRWRRKRNAMGGM